MSERFLFDQEFDASGRIRATAKGEVYDADELAAARAQAHADGQAEGERAALQSVDASLSTVLGSLATDMARLHDDFTAAMEAQNRTAVDIATTVARCLAGKLLDAQPLAEVEALIADCLTRMNTEPRLVIRTSEAVAGALKERLDEIAAQVGFQGHVVLMPEEGMGPQDCLIEWADGGVAREQAELEAEVDGAIESFLAASRG